MTVFRSIARGVAKNHMKQKGMKRICKQNRQPNGHTWFANNWREWVKVGGMK